MDRERKSITHDAFLSAEGFAQAKQLPVVRGGMSPEQFCYWLQGFFENANPKTLDAAETQSIKNHLQEVFHKVTPDLSSVVASSEMICDTGGDNVSIWGKYGDKLPSIFKETIYRLPTDEELKEVAEFKLTPFDLVQGFTYTMVGRGVPNYQNEFHIKQSLDNLIRMYPDRPEYKAALLEVKRKMNYSKRGGPNQLAC